MFFLYSRAHNYLEKNKYIIWISLVFLTLDVGILYFKKILSQNKGK